VFFCFILDFNKKPSTQSRSKKREIRTGGCKNNKKNQSRQKDDKIGQMAIQDMKYGTGLCLTMFPLKTPVPSSKILCD
jgi:hypothetical protein